MYRDCFFEQTDSTAMRSPLSPVVAGLFMDSKTDSKSSGLGMWTTPSLSGLIEHLNGLCQKIQFRWKKTTSCHIYSRCTSLQTQGHPNHLGVSQEDQDRSIPPLSISPPSTSQNQCGLLPQEEGRMCKQRKEPLKGTAAILRHVSGQRIPTMLQRRYSIGRNTDLLEGNEQ